MLFRLTAENLRPPSEPQTKPPHRGSSTSGQPTPPSELVSLSRTPPGETRLSTRGQTWRLSSVFTAVGRSRPCRCCGPHLGVFPTSATKPKTPTHSQFSSSPEALIPTKTCPAGIWNRTSADVCWVLLVQVLLGQGLLGQGLLGLSAFQLEPPDGQSRQLLDSFFFPLFADMASLFLPRSLARSSTVSRYLNRCSFIQDDFETR